MDYTLFYDTQTFVTKFFNFVLSLINSFNFFKSSRSLDLITYPFSPGFVKQLVWLESVVITANPCDIASRFETEAGSLTDGNKKDHVFYRVYALHGAYCLLKY